MVGKMGDEQGNCHVRQIDVKQQKLTFPILNKIPMQITVQLTVTNRRTEQNIGRLHVHYDMYGIELG